jgi:TRAP-type C4-dicarboxylate transport system permease small subunit
MDILAAVNRLVLRFFKGIMFIANVAIITIILTVAFLRYLLKINFLGSEEIILLIASWMYFLGSAIACYEGSQVSADLLSSSLKTERQRAVLSLVQFVISLVLFGVLTVWAFNYLRWSLAKRSVTPVYHLPLAISHVALLVSFFFSFLYQIMHIYRTVLKFMGHKEGGQAA